jgi:hypothetical protein
VNVTLVGASGAGAASGVIRVATATAVVVSPVSVVARSQRNRLGVFSVRIMELSLKLYTRNGLV